MQPIFYKRDFKWFIRTKWKVILVIFLILSVLGVTGWLLFGPKVSIDKNNLEFVLSAFEDNQLERGSI